MGPTNVALVNLFRADQALRDARERLDAATKNVRIQERRVNDLAEKLKLAQARHRELQAKGGGHDLDLRSRDAHLEKLREQQQAAKNSKEYQAFLVEINTLKLDKGKVEDEAMRVMEQADAAGKESVELTTSLEAERAKLATVRTEIGDTGVRLQAEIDSLTGPRERFAGALSPKARTAFDKLADHHDGEALSALIKPDRRKEEYACSVCMMDLVTDVYNKLHTRDDLIFCPSCRRILYIPDDLPVGEAVHGKKKVVAASPKVAKATPGETVEKAPAKPREPARPKNKLGQILTAAQGESVKNAIDADSKALEFRVTVDGRDMGVYKGKNGDNLERVIKYRFGEAKLTHEVQVTPVVEPVSAEPISEVASVEPVGDDMASVPPVDATTEPETVGAH